VGGGLPCSVPSYLSFVLSHTIFYQGNIVNCFCKSKSTHKLAGPYGQEYAFLFQFKVGTADTLCHAAFEITANYKLLPCTFLVLGRVE
jgi:hypothetical protein